jgi:hypothetical protein
MTEPQLIQGRWFTKEDLALLENWRQEHPEWSRYRLSRELAQHWNWRTPAGELRDMAARHFLHKLDQRGLFTLPAPNPKGGRQAAQWPAPASPPSQLIEQPLSQLQPLSLDWVRPRSPVARELAATLAHYHYLGWRGPVGPHLAYHIHDRHDRLLAVLVFVAAALQVAERDRFIGWSAAQRQARLHLLVQNARFLILPWVRVPHLASHVLAQVTSRLRHDWIERYQQPLVLVETFVQCERFAGTCYRAANWLYTGRTTGRGRDDRHHQRAQPRKDIYLCPLVRDWRTCLCA